MTLYDSEKGTVVCTGSPEEGWQIAFDGLTAKNEVPVYQPSDGAAGLYDPIGKKTTVLEGLAFPSGEPEVELHRSGQRAAWSDGDRIWIIDMETPRILLTLEASQGQYTDDDWYFRYVEKGESVYLRWDTLEEVCRSEYAGVLSPDGKWLATANNTESFTLWDASTQEMLWTEGHNSGNTLYSLAFVDDDTLIACHEEVQIYRLSDRSVVYDSGKERTTYGFDFAAGRLVMPLRAGGCQLNLLPDADDTLPHVMTETREGWSEDDFAAATTCFPLAGNWNGMAYYLFNGEDWVTLDTEEPGLLYLFDGKEYILYPVNGIVTSYIYVSPDGKWQALIRNEEVDLFRAEEGPEPVMTIPGNGYSRLCAAFYGDILALGSYVENLVLYDLNTGDCLGTVNTGAMCTKIQFSPDGKHLIAFSAMAERATVANTENLAAIMSIPVRSVYDVQAVGFGPDGTEAAVLYRDGKADVGLLYRDLDTLVEKARKYME